MNASNIKSFMERQVKALDELEELLAHDAKKQPRSHSVSDKNIEALREYIKNMRAAWGAAAALAAHYANEKAPTTKQAEEPNTESVAALKKLDKLEKKAKEDKRKEPPTDPEPEADPANEDDLDFLN